MNDYMKARDIFSGPGTKLEKSRELYKLANGIRRNFMELAVQSGGLTHLGAVTYFQRIHGEAAQQTHTELKELVDRFMHTADSISEDEMNQLHVYFTNIQNALKVCPPEYRLVEINAHNQLRRVQQALDAYAESRRNK